MTTTASRTYTDTERVELQRACVKEHLRLENAHEKDRVLPETFVQDGSAYYHVVPGNVGFDGLSGIQDFYDMLFSVLPDIHIDIHHQYDVPGCCVLEGVVTGTHSAEFAGVPASGNAIAFPFAAMYIFGDDPTRLRAERAYWDNMDLIMQMKGESQPPTSYPWDSVTD
jgi:predicted ester cyclase